MEASEKMGEERRERKKAARGKWKSERRKEGKEGSLSLEPALMASQQLLTPPKSSAMSRKEDGQKPGFAWGPTQA